MKLVLQWDNLQEQYIRLSTVPLLHRESGARHMYDMTLKTEVSFSLFCDAEIPTCCGDKMFLRKWAYHMKEIITATCSASCPHSMYMYMYMHASECRSTFIIRVISSTVNTEDIG